MDSNSVENAMGSLALNRKNALFAGHDESAPAWASIASLIETAEMNGVEPYAYLKTVIEAIVAGHPASKIGETLHSMRLRVIRSFNLLKNWIFFTRMLVVSVAL